MTLDLQIELFEEALAQLEEDPDLINQVLEVTADDGDMLHMLRYALPKD